MVQQESPIRVAFYIRVSTDDQLEKFGPAMQLDSLHAIVKSRGVLANGEPAMVLAGPQYIYREEGVSGTLELDKRPAFSKLKEDIMLAGEYKPFDAVLVYKIDRFARKLKILLEVVDFFENYKIDFISANEMIDTSTPFGKAMLNIIGVIAELERDTITTRMHDGRNISAKSGKIMSVGTIYGFKKDKDGFPEVVPEEAKIVQRIFTQFVVDRMSTYNIAKSLEDDGIVSPSVSAQMFSKHKKILPKKNKIDHWRTEKIRQILSDEMYVGIMYYNKTKNHNVLPKSEWKRAERSCPSIIDGPTFLQAQKRLEQTKYEKPSKEHIYLLSSLIKCNCCFDPAQDKEMSNWTGYKKELDKGKGNFTYAYICGRKNAKKSYKICNALPLPADQIEEYIINYTVKLLKNPELSFRQQQQLSSSKKELERKRTQFLDIENRVKILELEKENLKQQHQAGIIKSIQELQDKIKIVDEKITKAQERKQELEVQIDKETNTTVVISTLKLYATKYKDLLKQALKDRVLMSEIIHNLFEEIVVYTRPLTLNDPKVAGIKKDNQEIPDRLHLKVRIPKDLLNQVVFGGSRQELLTGAGERT